MSPSTGRPGSIHYSVVAVDDAFGQSYTYGKRPWVTERMNAYADTSRSYSYDNGGRLAPSFNLLDRFHPGGVCSRKESGSRKPVIPAVAIEGRQSSESSLTSASNRFARSRDACSTRTTSIPSRRGK